MDNTLLRRAAETFGTPAFLFDEDALTARMRAAAAITGDTVSLCYSIKANPFLIRAMLPCVRQLEVCSPGEMEICMALHVPPEAILFSGVNKTAEDLRTAIAYGVTLFTAESPLHLRLLEDGAAQANTTLRVLLRLTAGSQFGMDESDLRSAIAARAAFPHLDLMGLHFFSGTQRKKLTSQQKELTMLRELIASLKADLGFDTRLLEYGPGLYFPYFAHEDHTDTLAPLRELAPDLRALAEQVPLQIEMGRFFASECGHYLTTVADTKICRGYGYAIVDGGIHHVNYLGGNMGMRVPVITHLPGPQHSQDDPQDWALCGSLCTTADVLVRSVSMNGLVPGDLLVFRNIGAYSVTEGPALFLSRNMPRILLACGGEIRMARDTVHTSSLNCEVR